MKKGIGLCSVKYKNAGTHKRHSLSVEIEKGSGLRSVKCENVETHERHSRPVEIEKGNRLRSVKYGNVGTHKRHSLPVEIGLPGPLRSRFGDQHDLKGEEPYLPPEPGVSMRSTKSERKTYLVYLCFEKLDFEVLKR